MTRGSTSARSEPRNIETWKRVSLASRIGLGLEAALFAGQSARAGAASEAAAGGLHQEDIQHLAGVTTAEWLSWYNRRYLGERLRVSRALGL